MRRLIVSLTLSLLASLFAPVGASTLTPLDGSLLIYKTTSQGETREAAMREAKIAAVASASGRVFLDNKLLIADELLMRYIENYHDRFVTATEVVKDDFREGRNVLDVHVFVDYEKLRTDLDEKRFTWVPAQRPVIMSYLSEEMDGQLTREGIAREALAIGFQKEGLKPFEGVILSPPLSVDVSTDEFLQKSALVTAQRNGAEIVVAGTCVTNQSREKKLYYDNYMFYECEMNAKVLRADTGEQLFSVTSKGTGAARERGQAIQTAIQRAAENLAAEIAAEQKAVWPFAVQGRGDFQVVLTGIDEELLRVVIQHVEQMGSGTKVALRKKFGTSACLVINTPASKESLLAKLSSCPYPVLTTLNPGAKNAFEVQAGR